MTGVAAHGEVRALEWIGGAGVVLDREPRRREAALVVTGAAVAAIGAPGELAAVRVGVARLAALEFSRSCGRAGSVARRALDRGVPADQRETRPAVIEPAAIDGGPGGLAVALLALAAQTAVVRIAVASGARRAGHVADEEPGRGRASGSGRRALERCGRARPLAVVAVGAARGPMASTQGEAGAVVVETPRRRPLLLVVACLAAAVEATGMDIAMTGRAARIETEIGGGESSATAAQRVGIRETLRAVALPALELHMSPD